MPSRRSRRSNGSGRPAIARRTRPPTGPRRSTRTACPSTRTAPSSRLTIAPVRAYPDGLTIVAGNSHAGTPQSRRTVFWDCGVVKATLYGPIARDPQPVATPPAASSRPPVCPSASKLQLHVNFPDCWNGRTIDSVDHKPHMAYSVDGRCPRSHPVAVPELSVVYQYPPLAGMLALSSGGIYSGHADFVNAWDEDALKALVTQCLNALRPCGTGT